MAISHIEELLILTKTYPSPSVKYRETTCVAALNRDGKMRRLYPVPFRFLDGKQQFKKWEWIRASLISPQDDKRPESYRIDIDTITRTGEKITTADGWRERKWLIEPHVVAGFSELETRRQTTGETLGFVRPSRLNELHIKPVKETDWTESDKAKLLQDGLFDSSEVKKRPPLNKLPYDFYYDYDCETTNGIKTLRHKITDWEAGALYWRCYRDYGAKWERYFRQKLEIDFTKKDLVFLMGTIHRFPDQWLIVGLVYPPKLLREKTSQLSLDLGLANE